MDCHWLKLSPSLSKGLTAINKLDESRFEQFLRRIVAKLKLKDVEIFTTEERQKLERIFDIDQQHLMLSIKTLQYVFIRILKYIFMPVNLKNDLKTIGVNNDKAETIVKVWSSETRTTLNEIGAIANDKSDSLNFSWKLNAELSSDYHKKCKVPKAYLLLSRQNSDIEVELTHSDLYSMYLQFESVQNMLDNLIMRT